MVNLQLRDLGFAYLLSHMHDVLSGWEGGNLAEWAGHPIYKSAKDSVRVGNRHCMFAESRAWFVALLAYMIPS